MPLGLAFSINMRDEEYDSTTARELRLLSDRWTSRMTPKRQNEHGEERLSMIMGVTYACVPTLMQKRFYDSHFHGLSEVPKSVVIVESMLYAVGPPRFRAENPCSRFFRRLVIDLHLHPSKKPC